MTRISYVTRLLLLAGLLGLSQYSYGQKFAYVDTDYILDQIPEYRSAQKKLNEAALGWQKELEEMQARITSLKRNYQAEQVILSEEIKKEREAEIDTKQAEMLEFKKSKFGPKGELYSKRKELIKPIQDKVFNAIQELAKDNALDFIFDKSGAVTMLFSNAKYDRSDEVLDYMGISGASTPPSKE